jgi:hypothetical protein
VLDVSQVIYQHRDDPMRMIRRAAITTALCAWPTIWWPVVFTRTGRCVVPESAADVHAAVTFAAGQR